MTDIPLDALSELSEAGKGIEAAGEALSDSIEAAEMAEAVAAESQAIEEAAIEMPGLSEHAEGIQSELSEEEAGEFASELDEVDKEIEGAGTEFRDELKGETSEVESTQSIKTEEEELAEIEREKSRTAKEMSEAGIGENIPGSQVEESSEPVEEKPVTEENVSEKGPQIPEGQAIKMPDGNWMIYENGKWVDAENLDPETEEFAESLGFDKEDFREGSGETFTGPFSESEKAKYNEFYERVMTGETKPGVKGPEVRGAATEAAKAMEDKEARELMKIVLRIAVKVTATVASTVLKNLSKTLAKEHPALAAMVGSVGDLVEEGGKLGDTLVAGKKGESLGETMHNWYSRNKIRQSVRASKQS